MTLHQTSGRSGLGFALALTTMSLWSGLPFALDGLLGRMDAASITWWRFVAAALALLGVLAWRGALPPLRSLGRGQLVLLGTATFFLGANYLAYLLALGETAPADAQVLIQLAPLLLALGGIVVFRERFTPVQWTGFATLVAGLLLFSASQLRALVAGADRYVIGSALMVVASVTWAIYGLAQKQLLHHLSSQGIMVCIYAGCALLFTPIASPAGVLELDGVGVALLVFCALNTIVGYGAFSEALAHWEASRVSAVLSLTPMATIALGAAGSALWPDLLRMQPLSATSWLGAVLVVGGSLATSLGAADR